MKSLSLHIALSALLLFFSQGLLAGTLTASTDSTHIIRNETLTLTLKYDARSDEEPDTSELEKQFNIRRQGTRSGISIINGDVSSSTTWEYELSPKRTGQLLIPSFSINGNFSEAISITVDEKSADVTQTDQKIYTETSLDKPKIYTQQQTVITWRLVSRAGAPQVRFSPQRINGVITQDLGNRSYQRTGSNGSSEWVIEQRYALFPQQSGKITIPAQTFRAVVNEAQRHVSGFFISTPTEITRDTDEQQLDVMPPPNTGNKTWLPASSVEIFQKITGLNSQSQATAGTAFTRTIIVRANGLSAEQLPAPDMQANHVKIYAEKPVFDNKASSQGNIGTREDRAAVIATQAGKLVLPAIQIAWYDVNTAQWRNAEWPEETIDVLPNAAAEQTPSVNTTTPQAPTSPTTTANTSPNTNAQLSNGTASNTYVWQITAGVLALGLFLLTAYIYHLQQKIRKGHQPTKTIMPTQKNTATTDIQQALASGNLHDFHQSITQWATSPARRTILDQPDIRAALHILEKHLYGNGTAPTPDTLQTLVSILDQQHSATHKPTKENKAQLSSLY